MVFSTSVRGRDLIKHFEGLRLESYLCPGGVWTIGYGHTITARAGMTITEEEADTLLSNDLLTFERQVNRMVTAPILQHQFDALISFAYNVGTGSLRASTLLKRLNAENYAAAALEFNRWVLSRGKRLPGLVRRRAAERAMFEGKPGNTWEGAAA